MTPFPIRWLTAALMLTVAVLLAMGWSAFDSYRNFVTVKLHDLRLTELRGTIVHLDEVLTMSARMAATTGDLQWERRYRQFENPLDDAVKETMRLTTQSASAGAAQHTDEANLKLVDMENQAFAMVRAGQSGEAKKILFSDAYEAQKKIYAAGMATLMVDIKARLAASQHDLWWRSVFFGAIALFSVVLLVFTWQMVFGRLRQWRVALARAVAALHSAREDLEKRVEERTIELKRAQEEAAREQARFKLIFDSVPVGIAWMVDGRLEDTRIVNPAHARITGVPAAHCRDLRRYRGGTHPDDRVAQDALQQRLVSGAIDHYTIIKRYVHEDGTLCWTALTVRYIRDAANAEVQELSTVVDITAQRRTENALREREEHFRFLNDLGEATRPLADPEQIMVVMSRMLGEHLGASRCAYADVEQDGEQFTILHDYTADCASTVGHYRLSLFGARAVARLHSGQTLIIRDVEAELLPEDGADMFNAIGIKALIACPLVKGGSLRALMAVHQTTPRDWQPGEIAIVQEVVERCWAIIERRSAEENLRQSEALLRIAGRTARLGGWAVDLPESRVTWSDEMCAIHELPPGTVPGLEQALSFYAPQSHEMIVQAFEACVRQGAPFDLELELLTAKKRPIWVRAIGEAERNAAGTITRVQGAFQDITARKQAESELKQAHIQLVAVSRQAGMAEFATGILHNVGNVLNSVNVASICVATSLRKSKSANLAKVVALLREHEADLGAFLTNDPKGRQVPVYLAHLAGQLEGEQADALKELAHLQKNIEHIKEVVSAQQGSVKGTSKSETLQVTDLVEDTLRMDSGGDTPDDIQIIREFGPVPAISVEKHKVLQILMNLVRNAKQACREAGRAEKRLIVRVTKGDDGVSVAVSDNGVGISPENLARIFAHGFTTKKDGHGFGLHSAVAAAKEMGGSLTVHSDGPGCGATFTLKLPLPAGTGPP